MARRTPEEILEQREAWLARKAARESGQDIPIMPPLKPGEEPPADLGQDGGGESAAQPEETAQEEAVAQPQQAEPAPEPEAPPQPVAEAPAKVGPKKPAGKRSPEEVRAQREAWLARKTAGESGQAPPPQPAAAPKPAETPKAAPAPKPKAEAAPAPKRKAEPEGEPIDPNLTRRELLNYAWLASIGLFAVQTVGLSLWFAFPNFKEGEFGGEFPLGTASSVVPEVNSGPVPYTDGKFWLVNVDDESPDGEPRQGVLALFKVCTHLGCLYEWVQVTFRFECPCHGSKFSLTGDYLAGPARRSLDRFVIKAIAPDGTVRAQTNDQGDPLIVEPDDQLVIDTGARILGSSDIVIA